MSFGISGLLNNITGSIKSLGGKLGLTSPDRLNPEFPNLLSEGNAENWLKLPLPYTFAVVSKDQTLDPSFAEFPLPLAPQEIQQTEEFAISIKPTQGGTTVSHSGNRYKKLRISGTTGLAPFKGTGGADKYTGVAIFQPDELKYQSGFEVFKQLRNYFKAYYEYKKDMGAGKYPKEARLIFKNYKDGEFLIVELLTFDMKRSAGKPFLYDYVLEFKVLGHLKFSQEALGGLAAFEDGLNRAMAKLDAAKGVFLRASEILKQIESTYESVLLEPIRKTSLKLKAYLGLVYDVFDFPGNLIKSTVTAGHAFAALANIESDFQEARTSGAGAENTLLIRIGATLVLGDSAAAIESSGGGEALLNLGEGMLLVTADQLPESANVGLQEEIASVQQLPRSYFEDAINELQRMQSNAEDFFNLGSDAYDAIFDRTSTVTADSTREPSNDELDVLESFNNAISAINDMLASTTLFKNSYDDQISDLIAQFDSRELNLKRSTTILQVTLPAKTDLERLALEYLGDSSRWPEIAELNNLQSPFITQDTSSTVHSVAKPGDNIMIPTNSANGFGTLPDGKEIASVIGLSVLEKSFGTDLRLTPDFDLALSNSGDLEVISGSPNVGQATVLKLGYQRGEVLHAPSIGANLMVGSKTPSLYELKDDIIRTLNQDSRIEKITDLSVTQDGPAVYLFFKIKLKNVDTPIPVSVSI